MQTKNLLLLVIVMLFGLSMNRNVQAQKSAVKLINHETTVKQDPSVDLHFFNDKQAVTRYREVQVNTELKSLFALTSGDQITLNLFQDKSFTATVGKVEAYMDGNVTITSRISSFNYGYMIISTTENRTLAVIEIPELAKKYKIISDPISNIHYLIDLNPALMMFSGDENSNMCCTIYGEEDEHDNIENEETGSKIDNQMNSLLGPEDVANIDVMIVYTPSARDKANEDLGGISNLIAYAIALGQLVLDSSNTEVNLKLVHNSVIDYTESGDIAKDLNRLRKKSDGYMDEVHDWRNYYGADLVQLFGYGLDKSGKAKTKQHEAYAFSIVGIYNIDYYSSIHEMGHNMGCGHHKEQEHGPGPNLFNYSAGWRWTGNDNEEYCSVMTYESGGQFEDGIYHKRVARFSNPSIDYAGVATGHSSDGDNARTIRETKHDIAAYREDAAISCIECPGYNWEINPSDDWKISSSTIGTGDCKIYRFNAEEGRSYWFKTGCGDGATADFDTKLFLLTDSICGILTENNDGCEDLRSQIHWVASYEGYAYIKVRGYDGATGSYTLAYQRPPGCSSDLQNPSTTLVPEEHWQYQEGLYPGEFARFLVTEGETYHWQLCADKGASAPYDSELTLLKGSSDLIIEFSDNVCSDDAKISWTADFTGGVKLVITKSGCETGNEPTTLAYKAGTLEDPYLTLTPDREVFSNSGTATFYLGSNTSWNLSKDASWITSLNPKSGSGPATITIEYNANPTSLQRAGTLTASAPVVSNQEVTIKQYPSDAYCNSNLSMGTTLVPADEWQYNSEMFAGMFATTPVVSGMQYHWSLCSLHGAAVLFDAELILRRSDNNEFIAFSDGGCGFSDAPVISWTADFTGNVKIILANSTCENGDIARIGYKSGELTTLTLTSSHETIFIPAITGITTFYVYTELPWDIYIPPSKDPSWISAQPQSGAGNAQITVNYLANPVNIQRQGSVVINAGSASATVSLVQMPNDGQCNSLVPNGYPNEISESWQYAETIVYNGHAGIFSVNSGLTYHWSLCPQHGGEATFNSELTLRRAADNAFIAYNNNMCGDDARISWTADFTGEVKLVLSEFPCNPPPTPARIAYKSGALVNPFPVPPAPLMTPANRTVSPAGGSTTFNIISNTHWNLTGDGLEFYISQTSGTGNAVITAYYGPNTGAERTFNISGSVLHVPGTFANNTITQTDFCTSQTYLTTETPLENWDYITCIRAGEYVVFPVVTGEKYQWSLADIHGGNAPFHSELTLRKESDNSFLAYSNNYNGVGQDAYILWNADFTGDVKLVFTEINCQTSNQTCSRMAYKKGDLVLPFVQFDPSLTSVDSEPGTFDVNIYSNTHWNITDDGLWLLLSQTSGAGNSTINVNYLENTCLPREGKITGSAFGINDVNTLLIQESNLLTVPSAYAGFDATILIGQIYPIQSATATNYTSLEWTTNGTGYFSDPTIINPIYFPGLSEFGQTTLSLSLLGTPGCFFTSSTALNILQGIPIMLDLKVMLEGPFSSGQMTINLNGNGLLPLTQPYNQEPWNYLGLETVPVIPSVDVVDWVYVELRHSEDEPEYFEPEFTTIDRKAGFLFSDGSIRDLDGISLLNMQVANADKTRVAIWHRNHISVISSSVIEHLSGSIYQWNFTNAMAKARNNGQKPLGGNFFGMIAGDGNADGIIDYLDQTSSWYPFAGNKGYYQGDYDANTDVDNKDKNENWYPNLGAGTQVPQ